jgi:hypothetical protein
MARYPKVITVSVALVVFFGAEYVSAAIVHETTTAPKTEPISMNLTAAELDPVFTQKLAARLRAPYERSHQTIGSM